MMKRIEPSTGNAKGDGKGSDNGNKEVQGESDNATLDVLWLSFAAVLCWGALACWRHPSLLGKRKVVNEDCDDDYR